MNGYQVPDFIKKGEYHIRTLEESERYAQEGIDRDAAVNLLSILMTSDQPLTAKDVLARVRAWSNKRDQENKPFYFYWGQCSFREYLDDLVDVFFLLKRVEEKGIVKYQASALGLEKLNKHQGWLENYLGETFEEIKKTFPPLPTE